MKRQTSSETSALLPKSVGMHVSHTVPESGKYSGNVDVKALRSLKTPQRPRSLHGSPMRPSTSNSSADRLPERSSPPPVAHSSVPDIPWSSKVRYYFPISTWLPSYTPQILLCDLVAGLSLASYQIPLSMSFASAIAHVPPICGLVGLSVAPIVYSLLGTVPQMIVGPEAATSLVVGQAIESVLKHSDDPSAVNPVDLLSVITFVSGCTLLGSGLARFGFLDNVLCGALLRGFITGIGIAMEINSGVGMLGLNKVLAGLPSKVHLHSSYSKLLFLLGNLTKAHYLTMVMGLSSFVAIFVLRYFKKLLVHHNIKKAVFFPEILFVVILSTVVCTAFDLEKDGVEVVGKIHLGDFHLRVPFNGDIHEISNQLLSTGVMAAVLGFFESTTAAKALGSNTGVPVSSNRELVALGVVGLSVSMVGALPSFGGYGRSKMNAMTGAKTCFSGAFMGLVTILVSHFLLNYLENLPNCVLSAIIGVVGISLLEEAPKDLAFHYKSRGWNELITFAVTAFASFFYSVDLGIALGCVYSVIRVIKHSAQSRIQILAREQDSNIFVNADESLESDGYKITIPGVPSRRVKRTEPGSLSVISSPLQNNALEEIEGCLIVKIPEPLTFTNAADLQTRLRRIEMYGSTKAHPSNPRHRQETMNRNIIFDLHGMTGLDSSASQLLKEIIENYQKKGKNVFFCRVPHFAEVRERLQNSGIKALIEASSSFLFGNSTDWEDSPYYEDIPDAIKAVDDVEAASAFSDITSFMSTFAF
ncbi:unnamed protein product [Kuraishia capsulata CBS 1993]|uniref:STAS domain-containing protein n=1 Tax=Kuraishia capsulata CBS 1993 TaxID=1382522 RepID=W6MKP5_9ASCO|nr:uncharacterized protein KUCA_T00002948001 [Kuraishia capsulata CBS 1993]CDK26971.1 unnamed protein product [Kuraishia capsulata CBS 1993]